MRIGLFTDTYVPQINGVTTTVKWLVEELDRLGHEVFVFCPHYHRREPRDPRVIRFPSLPFIFHRESRVAISVPLRARRIISSLDVVHSHTPFSLGTLALWAARRYRLPHVHTYHTLFVAYRHYLPPPLRPPRRLAEWASAAFCNRCDAVTVESTPIKEELLRYGVRVPIHVFPFGVNLRLFSKPLKRDLRWDLGLPPGTKIALYVGRLALEKNIFFLLRAFAIMSRERDDVVFVLLGGGPATQALLREVKRLDLSGRVFLPGYVPHEVLVDYYRSADIFIFASKTETQGLVVLEAMAAGLPVIALRAMGVADIVQEGINGIFAPEDPRAFARVALEVLEDGGLRERLREGALARARELSTEASTRKLLRVFQEVRDAGAAGG